MAIFQQTLEKLQHFPLHPVASETATFTGATTNIADLNDFDGDIQLILDAGAAGGSGTMTGKIQHSDTTTSGDFSDVTGGGFTAVAVQKDYRGVLCLRVVADNDIHKFGCVAYKSDLVEITE